MIEITVKDKDNKDRKFRFRDEFMVLDSIHIGLPLIDIKKFEDPITHEVNLDPTKMDSRDLQMIQLWNLNLATEMSMDHIDFGHQKDIYMYNQIQIDPKFKDLASKLINAIQPPMEPLDVEKKKIMESPLISPPKNATT